MIGVACPDEYPLLGFVSLVGARDRDGQHGDRDSVAERIRSPRPTSISVLETSDVPAGVVNIVTGDKDALAKVLAEHDDVDAVWYFGAARGRQGGRAGVGVEHEADLGDLARPRLARTSRRRGTGVSARGDAGEEHLDAVRRVSPEH